MNLPSFWWLWKIAAWSIGWAIVAYLLLAISGIWMFNRRRWKRRRPSWLRPFHYITGAIMVFLVLLLLGIGVVGTIGYYGSLGHSQHLFAGLLVVMLVLISAGSATQISGKLQRSRSYQVRFWRSLHVGANILLFGGFAWVCLTGWDVVQKYLP